MSAKDYDDGLADGMAGKGPSFERLALGANRVNAYERGYIDSGKPIANLMETQNISPACRANRTVGGAWDEAVRRLREIYDAQVAYDPTLTIALSISRVTPEPTS